MFTTTTLPLRDKLPKFQGQRTKLSSLASANSKGHRVRQGVYICIVQVASPGPQQRAAGTGNIAAASNLLLWLFFCMLTSKQPPLIINFSMLTKSARRGPILYQICVPFNSPFQFPMSFGARISVHNFLRRNIRLLGRIPPSQPLIGSKREAMKNQVTSQWSRAWFIWISSCVFMFSRNVSPSRSGAQQFITIFRIMLYVLLRGQSNPQNVALNTGSIQRGVMPLALVAILSAIGWIARVLWTDWLLVFFCDTAPFQLLRIIFSFFLEKPAFDIFPTFTSTSIMIKLTCLGLPCFLFLCFLFLLLFPLLLFLPICLCLFPLLLEL